MEPATIAQRVGQLHSSKTSEAMARMPQKTRDPRGSKPRDPSDERIFHRTLERGFYVHMEMVDRANRALVKTKLGLPHHRALYFVVRQPGISLNELRSILRISHQALSRTIQELRRLNLIEQKPGQEDRRRQCNHPTPKGLTLLRKLTKLQYQHVDQCLAGVSERELDVFWDVLLRMMRDRDRTWITTFGS